MACGLPVITTLQNGAADIIEHGRDGLVFDRKDAAALDDFLQTLGDRDLRQKMALAAREQAQRHSLERNFETIYRLYVRIADRKRGHVEHTNNDYQAYLLRMRVSDRRRTDKRADEASRLTAEELAKKCG
jgi:hypothetical protein